MSGKEAPGKMISGWLARVCGIPLSRKMTQKIAGLAVPHPHHPSRIIHPKIQYPPPHLAPHNANSGPFSYQPC